MDKVFYCIPTYKSYDLAYDGVLAALRGTLIPEIIIIDNSAGPGTQYLLPLQQKYSNVQIWPQMENIGVSKAWNLFHATLQQDYVIIANDDVKVHPYTIEKMVTAAKSNPRDILFAGDGSSGNAFSLFLLTRQGFNTIGRFDERFSPAYFEDNDYARRMLLLGYMIRFVSGATYDHIGSSTLAKYTPQEMELHHNAFRRNHEYYMAKWGGLPAQEIYETPFNK